MNYITLTLVEYNRGTKGFAFAPLGTVCAGQRIRTEFGFGNALATETVGEDDSTLNLLKKVYTIDRVLDVLNPVDWGNKDDISDQRKD